MAEMMDLEYKTTPVPWRAKNMVLLLDKTRHRPWASMVFQDTDEPEANSLVCMCLGLDPSEAAGNAIKVAHAVTCHDDLVLALGRLIAMVDQMAKPPSKGGGVMPIDNATTMYEARAAFKKALPDEDPQP